MRACSSSRSRRPRRSRRRIAARALTDWERNRIAEMYREGYAARPFSEMVLDTSAATPDACAARIARQVAATAS
ncbi:hypothetical protein K562_20759 [Burkholderia cenocepacia]|nr:hypothetical protein BURCENK562V_C2746 [Burkholderia cenocepacia K56-2Valvano]QNN06537.1 hypothetical protein K562_20759 [Burkholderia cenocepacia]